MEKQTPLIDLLESVPRDAVLVVEHDQFSSSSYPVGRLCHEAAAALRAVLAEVERLRAEVERLSEALRELVAVFSESGMYDEEVFAKARAALAEENSND